MADRYIATARRLLSMITLRVLCSTPGTEPLEVLRVVLRGDGWEHVTLVPGDFPAASITAALVRHGYLTRRPEPGELEGDTAGDWTWIRATRSWTATAEPYDGRPRRGIVTLPPGSVTPPPLH